METFSETDIKMMKRCFHLAKNGGYHVKTNPLVGAVITYHDRIIGEGYHKIYGGPHAEIVALNSVKKEDRHLLSESQMYVSLEPCFHFGKTPPCVDAVLDAKIPRVTISNLDPNPKTKGKSLAKLASANIVVRKGLLAKEGQKLNKKFFTIQDQKRPFVILKWAQSKDGYIGQKEKQIWLSNAQSKFIVHRWRSEIDAILVGTNTVVIDNPRLTNRLASGPSPKRVMLDRKGRVPTTHFMLDDPNSTIVYTTSLSYPVQKEEKEINVLPDAHWSMEYILQELLKKGIASVMIEGGAGLLNSCIIKDLWDEARIIHTPIIIDKGIKAPFISGEKSKTYHLMEDKIVIINKL